MNLLTILYLYFYFHLSYIYGILPYVYVGLKYILPISYLKSKFSYNSITISYGTIKALE